MSYVIKEQKVMNQTIKIVQDESPESPREWDNLTKMIFFGNYRHLGEEHDFIRNQSFNSRDEFITCGEDILRKEVKDIAICYAVHVYNHGGVSISIDDEYPYNDRWDSGTIGFVIITKEDIRKNWGIKNVTKKYIEQADKILRGEVKTLNYYISGEVYGFIIEDENGEHIDSCYGFYGSDIKTNGIAEHIGEEFVKVLEN